MADDSLIFCDRVAHVHHAKREYPDARIVALTPQVREVCRRESLSHVCLETYVDAEAVNRVADATLARQYTWAKWLDDSLAATIAEFRESDFAPATANILFLKWAIDWYLLPATVLALFLEAARPSRVIVFRSQPFRVVFGSLAGVQRPLYSLLAPVLAPVTVHVEILSEPSLTHREHLHDRVEARAYRLLRRTAGRILRWARRSRQPHMTSGPRLAWVGITGGDIDSTIAALERMGIVALRPPRELSNVTDHAEKISRLQDRLRPVADTLMRDPAFWCPVDSVSSALRPLIGPMLREWIERDLPRFWAQWIKARNWLSEGRFSAAVGIEVDSSWTSALFHAAKSLGLMRFARIHNGGLFQDLPPVDCLGPTQSDLLFVNGAGDERYFQDLARRYPQPGRGVTIPVGSPRLDAVARVSSEKISRLQSRMKANDRRPIVLYVPTMLMGCYRYFCEGFTSDTAYVALQQRILRCFCDFPQVRLLYKPMSIHWTQDPIPGFIKREIPNGEVVTMLLTDLMWAVDAIIVDFSATAVTEAVLTDKPLIVYAGHDWARIVPEAKSVLARRASVSETPEEFELDVRRFLEGGNFDAIRTGGEEFRRLYCTHLDDGKSADRIAQTIARLIADPRPSGAAVFSG